MEFLDRESVCEEEDNESSFFVPQKEDLELIDDSILDSDTEYLPPNPYLPVSKPSICYIFSPLTTLRVNMVRTLYRFPVKVRERGMTLNMRWRKPLCQILSIIQLTVCPIQMSQ